MSKKSTVQPQDKYVVRLPDGMRERIKKAAEDAGRSMNSEIVRALEIAFPEPISIKERLEELHHLLSALSKVRGVQQAVDALTEEVASVVQAATEGRDPSLDEETLADLHRAILRLKGQRELENDVRRRRINDAYAAGSEGE